MSKEAGAKYGTPTGDSAVEAGMRADADSGPLPRRHLTDPFLIFCRVLNALACIAAVLVLVANVVSLVTLNSVKLKGTPISEILLRIYAIFFSVLIILVELELHFFLRWLLFITGWIGRGQFQIFVGILVTTFVRFDFTKIDEFQRASGFALIGIGALYSVMGLLCLNRLKERRRHQMEVNVQADAMLAQERLDRAAQGARPSVTV
eukprot:tig00001224_g7646.t1